MRAKLANINHCAVSFLSHAAINLCRYYYIYIIHIYRKTNHNSVKTIEHKTKFQNVNSGRLNIAKGKQVVCPNADSDSESKVNDGLM